MRQKLALATMLAGSLTFLVSLYFDWLNEADCHYVHCFAIHTDPSVVKDGWTGFGQIAAVLAIALAAGAFAAAANGELATRLPLGRAAVALGIFALLSVSELWTIAIAANASLGVNKNTIGLGPGAYIGLAGVGVAGAGAVAARWGEIRRPRRATAAVGTLITLALIASFVLPALNAPAELSDGFTWQLRGGFGAFICAFACLGLLAWQGRRPGPRLATAAAIGTLVAAQLLPYRHDYAQWPYELWLLLGCSAGLLALGLVGSRGAQLRRPHLSELAIVAGSVLLLVSLFLPWDSGCDPGGGCFSVRGWSDAPLAGVFGLGLLLALVWAGRFVRELAIGAAIFVLMAGLATATFSLSNANVLAPKAPPSHLNFVYGAPLGFAGAALIVAFSLGRFRTIPDKRLLVRLVPILAALALLAFAVAPNALNLADILYKTDRFGLKSPFVTLLLLGAMTILSTVRLLLRWFDRPGDHREVVLLPLALLALTALAVIHDHIVTTTDPTFGPIYGKGISWEGWVAIFLCLLLVACGWVARNGGGLERSRKTDGSASTTALATDPV